MRRQSEKAANATINRELAALSRAFTLGVDGGKLTHKPKIAQLRENNARTGFFERYNIVSEQNLVDAANKLDIFAGTNTGTTGQSAPLASAQRIG